MFYFKRKNTRFASFIPPLSLALSFIAFLSLCRPPFLASFLPFVWRPAFPVHQLPDLWHWINNCLEQWLQRIFRFYEPCIGEKQRSQEAWNASIQHRYTQCNTARLSQPETTQYNTAALSTTPLHSVQHPLHSVQLSTTPLHSIQHRYTQSARNNSVQHRYTQYNTRYIQYNTATLSTTPLHSVQHRYTQSTRNTSVQHRYTQYNTATLSATPLHSAQHRYTQYNTATLSQSETPQYNTATLSQPETTRCQHRYTQPARNNCANTATLNQPETTQCQHRYTQPARPAMVASRIVTRPVPSLSSTFWFSFCLRWGLLLEGVKF